MSRIMAQITKVTAVAHSSFSPKRMAVTPLHKRQQREGGRHQLADGKVFQLFQARSHDLAGTLAAGNAIRLLQCTSFPKAAQTKRARTVSPARVVIPGWTRISVPGGR